LADVDRRIIIRLPLTGEEFGVLLCGVFFSSKHFEKNPTCDLNGYEETRRVGQVGTEGMALHDVEILELCWLAEAFCINI
jgi:hypothetical protein